MSTLEPFVPTGLVDQAVATGATAAIRQVTAARAQSAVTCWCDRPSRGHVAAEGEVAAHECHDCSPEHCWHAKEARRCRFGTCPFPATAELPDEVDVDGSPLRVCTLHVGPALSWGRVEPISELLVIRLDQGRGVAA